MLFLLDLRDMTVTCHHNLRITITVIPPYNEVNVQAYHIRKHEGLEICKLGAGHHTCYDDARSYARKVAYTGVVCYYMFGCGNRLLRADYCPPKSKHCTLTIYPN